MRRPHHRCCFDGGDTGAYGTWPGLLESVYEQALALELEAAGLEAKTQVAVPVSYRGRDLGLGFRADLVVEEQLLVELK
ncbi:MAG: GxxExxY protein, partial [Gammaproteobacteria bacterium]|nr:GxxExxY protein [Gammaproteobacteria bacterium]